MRLLPIALLALSLFPSVAVGQTMPGMPGTNGGGGMPSGMGGSGMSGMPGSNGGITFTRWGNILSAYGMAPGAIARITQPPAIDSFKVRTTKADSCGVIRVNMGTASFTEVGAGTPAAISALSAFTLPTYDIMSATGESNGVRWVNPQALGVTLVDPVCSGTVVPVSGSIRTAKHLYIGGNPPGADVMFRFKVQKITKKTVSACGHVHFDLKQPIEGMGFDALSLNGMPSAIPTMGALIPQRRPPICVTPTGATTGLTYVPLQ